MQYLDFTKQRPVLLQTLCAEELRVTMDGTRNLIDMESKEKLRVTMRADVIARYEQELQKLSVRLKKVHRLPEAPIYSVIPKRETRAYFRRFKTFVCLRKFEDGL